MKVSVLIHNLNRALILDRCLSSVAVQTYRPLEVVMLDAGSTDSSKEVIDHYAEIMRNSRIEVRSMSCPLMGVAASRNLAARHATGDLLCVIDNDASFVGIDNIDSLVNTFGPQPRLAVISFRILKADTNEVDSSAWVFRRSREDWADRSFKTFTFTGGGFCIRTNVFWNVGGFWDQLGYSREEEEMGLALINAGWDLLYYPAITIRHYSDVSGRSSIAQRRALEMQNGLLVFWRRLPVPIALSAICARIFTMSAKCMIREKKLPNHLLTAIKEAVTTWRKSGFQRYPVSFSSAWRYAVLHFSR